MQAQVRTVAFAAFVGIVAAPLSAQDIEWNGFFTTGLAVTDSPIPYQSNVTQKAKVTDETLFGLNVAKNLTEEWRVAAQFLSRAGQADGAAKVDWAFVTYKPNTAFDLTLGKQKIPMWMISTFRDVGRTYPWVNPPEEVYTVFTLRSFTGASANSTIQLGPSTLSITPYGGDVILETAPSAPTTNSKVTGNNMVGASIEWTLDKFQLRAAYNKALWNLNISDTVQYGERRYEIINYGLKWENAGFLLYSEYGGTTDLSEREYDDKADRLLAEAGAAEAADDTTTAQKKRSQAAQYQRRIGGSKGYYVTIGQQIGSFLPHFTYASLKRPLYDYQTRDQDSQALGLNYDINAEAVIKAEAKRVHVPDGSQGLFTALPDKSDAMVYRLSYSLIF